MKIFSTNFKIWKEMIMGEWVDGASHGIDVSYLGNKQVYNKYKES